MESTIAATPRVDLSHNSSNGSKYKSKTKIRANNLPIDLRLALVFLSLVDLIPEQRSRLQSKVANVVATGLNLSFSLFASDGTQLVVYRRHNCFTAAAICVAHLPATGTGLSLEIQFLLQHCTALLLLSCFMILQNFGIISLLLSRKSPPVLFSVLNL